MSKGTTVVYIDAQSKEHTALVTALNPFHEECRSLVYVDLSADESHNLVHKFDVVRAGTRKENNPLLPSYDVNCWKEIGELHLALPADHPAFDHPFKPKEVDQDGIPIPVARPAFEAEMASHQASLPSSADLDQVAEEDKARFETKHYSDGSFATGVAPLPPLSPQQQAQAMQPAGTVVFDGTKPTSEQLKALLDEGNGVAVVSDGTQAEEKSVAEATK